MRKSSHIETIESRFGRPFREVVRELTEAGATNAEVSRRLGISYPTLRYLLLREGARFYRTVRFHDEREGTLAPL